MLSPATPLTIAFLVAFVLLLLSTLTTPVIASIPLGTYKGYNLGVFGWCRIADSSCSNAKIGYNATDLWPPGEAPDNFSSGTRITLTYILIIHPIAAFLVFICTILAAAAHFPAPGHSSRYLLGLLILTFPTLLVTLLAFLVDILLFIPPHMGWGGWIVLPATLIITACSVVTCAMRRTLVSRKARKERIEKNEDMNGSTYYQMKQETQFRAPESQFRAPEPSYVRAESPPPLAPNGALTGSMGQEKSAQFDSYEYDSAPLRGGNASIHTNNSGQRQPGSMSDSTMFGGAAAAGALGAAGAMSARGEPSPTMPYDDRSTPGGSFDRSRPSRGGGGPGYGRGGPPPQFYPRGRGGPRGSRGGYPPRGSFGRGRGGPRGPPPPGWSGGYGRGGSGPMPGRGRPGPPPGYPNAYYGGPPPPLGPDGATMYPGRGGSYSGRSSSERARGQWAAPEENFQSADGDWDLNDTQDESTPQPAGPPYMERSGSQGPDSAAPAYERRPSTGDSRTRDPASFGFSGRVPSPARSGYRSPTPPPPVPPVIYTTSAQGHVAEMDANANSPKPYARDLQDQDSAPYGGQSGGTYLSRAAWQAEPAELGNRSPPSRYDSPTGFAAAGDGAVPNTHDSHSPTQSSNRRAQGSSDGYYEDMDPRFSEDTQRPQYPTDPHQPQPISPHDGVPSSLMPGAQNYTHPSNPPVHPNSLYPSGMSDPHDDSRSPAASEDEGSNFTSISQRGVNPDWQPAHGWSGNVGSYGPASQRGPVDPNWRGRDRDQILTANPDFALPGAGPGRAGRGSAGGHARGLSSGASHRYPDPV